MTLIKYLRQNSWRGQVRLTPFAFLVCLAGMLWSVSLSAQTAIKLSDGAATFASSQFQAASFAVDGDPATRWESNHAVDPAFLTIDLGQAYNLSQVVIDWEAANAANYTIQGSNNNSSWTTLATRTGGSFGDRTDTVAISGNYRYVRMNGTARSVGNDWGYSIWEMAVYGSSNSNLPAPWNNGDVGSPLPGSVSFSNGVFNTTANGNDIWNNTDNFHFVYQPFNGDGAIIAQVTSLSATHEWAKAGVMFRENLTGGSKNAMMAMTSSNGAIFQRRTAASGTSTSNSQGGVFTPYWVKLTRNGNTLTGFSSFDGNNWTQVGTATVSMNSNAYAGLAHTSHAAGTLGNAQFDQVTVQAGAVCFYENTNFGGASFCRGAGAQNVPSGWSNRVSSVRVINGYSAVLRSQANQGGSSVTLTGDTANLASIGFDNLLASYTISNQAGGMKVVGYMPSWAGNATAIQYNKLTHINYSFVLPNANGSLQGVPNPSKLQSIVTLGHANGVKVLIAVGGWNDGNDSAFEALAANASTRTAFVNNLINLVEQYNLDGVDMDWEYPDPGASADNYALLMGQLSNALRARGKLLTAAVVASGYTGGGVKAEVFNYIDFLNLMAYDGGNGSTHSPYSYAVSSLNYWLGRGLPKEKAVLGVPYYARPSWSAYNTLVGANAANACRDSNGSDYWNGIPTIRQKAQLARSQAGGIMTWELSQDTNGANSLLTAMYEAVNGLGGSYNCN
ncbi:glycosyl hydrolase family 18 protein [Cellvibrio sp. ARAG 10.3]|uniref:glycosyl hydrolase family 18 protein n=1 Tax=Cellvibrio sp. ARAG 10.3 TaxID=3451358 RepID=UPI003F4757FB